MKWNIGIYCIPEIVAMNRVSGWKFTPGVSFRFLRNWGCWGVGGRPGRAGSSGMEPRNQNETGQGTEAPGLVKMRRDQGTEDPTLKESRAGWKSQ